MQRDLEPNKQVNHLDLFSGIGGFALAAEWCGITTVGFSEIDPYASAVLAKHWPSIKNYGDIRTITKTTIPGEINLITGGFPCQPFSTAGKQRGRDDPRDLWPEMFRVIKEFRPRWVVGENVAGFVKMELDRTLADLESEGYTVRTFIIPACAVNAPHRRDRVWVIAYAESLQPLIVRTVADSSTHCPTPANAQFARRHSPKDTEGTLEGTPLNKAGENAVEQSSRCDRHRPTANAQGAGLPCSDNGSREEQLWRGYPRDHWRNTNWLEAATLLCRVGNGLPNRTHRIKALGNAIVPQVAYEILHAISCLTPDRSGRSSRLKEANES